MRRSIEYKTTSSRLLCLQIPSLRLPVSWRQKKKIGDLPSHIAASCQVCQHQSLRTKNLAGTSEYAHNHKYYVDWRSFLRPTKKKWWNLKRFNNNYYKDFYKIARSVISRCVIFFFENRTKTADCIAITKKNRSIRLLKDYIHTSIFFFTSWKANTLSLFESDRSLDES